MPSTRTTRKRKVDETSADDEEPPKLTKRQEREAAKARARAWAERHQSGTESAKSPAKSKAAPKATRKRTSRRSTGSSKAAKQPVVEEEDDEEEEEEVFTSPTKRRKMTHTKQEEEKPAARNKKQQIEEARARAEAWAKQQQQQKQQSEPNRARNTSPKKPAKRASPLKQNGGRATRTASFVPPTSVPTPSVRRHPPASNEDKLEDLPWNQNEASISQAKKTQPVETLERPTLVEPPSRAVEQAPITELQPTPPAVEPDTTEALEPTRKARKLLAIFGGLIGLMAIAAGIWLGPENAPSSSIATKAGLPPCFETNYMPKTAETKDESAVEEKVDCDRSEGEIPCPRFGLCWKGRLDACLQNYLQVSENADKCVLTNATLETLKEVENALSLWTIEQMCSVAGCKHAIHLDESDSPLFDLTLVRETVGRVELGALEFSDSFLVTPPNSDGQVLVWQVGLSEDFVTHSLPVPTLCYLSGIFFWLIEEIMAMVLSTAQIVMAFTLSVSVAYPLASTGCALVLWLMYAARRRRRQNLQLLKDVAHVRQLAYDAMMEDSTTEHFVLHLRDEVALDLHPASQSKRNYVIQKVWPRVVGDVKRDNRVLKTTRVHQGTPRDVWQWVATPRKTRVSFGGR